MIKAMIALAWLALALFGCLTGHLWLALICTFMGGAAFERAMA